MTCAWTWDSLEPRTELYGFLVAATACAVLPLWSWRQCAAPEKGAASSLRDCEDAARPLLAPDREAWVDSARLLLIVFVVTGHFVGIACYYVLERSYWLSPLLAWINLIAMQGFAVLSGYLSK